MLCCVVLCCVMLCCIVLCCVMLCHVVLVCVVSCCVVLLCHVVLCHVVLWCLFLNIRVVMYVYMYVTYLSLYEWLSSLNGCPIGHGPRSVTQHL